MMQHFLIRYGTAKRSTMPMPKNPRQSVVLTRDLNAALKARAKKEDRSESQLIKRALADYLKVGRSKPSDPFKRIPGRYTMATFAAQRMQLAGGSQSLALSVPYPHDEDMEGVVLAAEDVHGAKGFVVGRLHVVVEYDNGTTDKVERKGATTKPPAPAIVPPPPASATYALPVAPLRALRPFVTIHDSSSRLSGVLHRNGYAYASTNVSPRFFRDDPRSFEPTTVLLARARTDYDGPDVNVPWWAIDALPKVDAVELTIAEGSLYFASGDEWVWSSSIADPWLDVEKNFAAHVAAPELLTSTAAELLKKNVANLVLLDVHEQRCAFYGDGIDGFVGKRAVV